MIIIQLCYYHFYAMHENDISYLIRGAVFRIYNELGPGLLESIYLKILYHELNLLGLKVSKEVKIPIIYDNHIFEDAYRADLIINNKVIVELKSVEELKSIHYKQLNTYLKITNIKLGLLINFNSTHMQNGIKRVVNGL